MVYHYNVIFSIYVEYVKVCVVYVFPQLCDCSVVTNKWYAFWNHDGNTLSLKANISLHNEYFYHRVIETRLPLYLFDLHVTTILL